MSTSVASVTKHFPSAENGFTTTLASTISGGAATVPLNSVAGYANGEVAVFVVDPTDVTKKQTFTGTIDTAGVQVTSVVWTAGTNQTHSGGATVVDYATATHISMITKGLLVEHDQDGTHSDITATSITATTGTFDSITINDTENTEGYSPLGATPNTVTYNGNRSYDLVFNANDLTDTLSNGMRLLLTRTVTAPTQCTDLESGSSQYYNKTSPAGMTFTDDFVVSGWIKLESYGATVDGLCIASRYNATSGWFLRVGAAGAADGRVQLAGFNASGANFSSVISYQSVPLNKWVHVAAQLDMSAFTATTTTSYVMIDGVDVPAFVTRGGTNPTALIQAGNLEVGSCNGGATALFDGKLAQVAIYSAKVTQANVRATISQTLTGSETSLISAYSFNNSIADLNTTNANNLTAQGSAVATNTDSPFANRTGLAGGVTAGTTEYAVITSNTFSTNTTLTVRVPDGCAIPTTGGVSAVSYSTQESPYGFPGISNILGQSLLRTTQGSITAETIVHGLTLTFTMPTTNKSVRLRTVGAHINSGSATDVVRIRETNISGTIYDNKNSFVASATAAEDVSLEWIGSLSPGTYTFVVTLAPASGTITYNGGQFYAELV